LISAVASVSPTSTDTPWVTDGADDPGSRFFRELNAFAALPPS